MERLILAVLMTILVSFGIGSLLLFLIFKKVYSYWNKFDIPVIPPQIPYGSLGNPITETVSVHDTIAKAYKKFKENNQKHGGMYVYLTPYYVPVDPAIIKNILIKDYNYFSERNLYINKLKDPLNYSLMTAEYQEWKEMRNNLTPLFTIHKLKLLFPLFQIHSDRLVKIINDYIKREESVEIKNAVGCYTTDIMASYSFGVECNSLENSNCVFRRVVMQIFHVTPFRFFKADLTRNFPNFARFLGLTTFSKQVSSFLMKVVGDNIDYRMKNNTKYNDLFQSLMEFEKNEIDDEIKKVKIAAQALLFLGAGSEASSITTTCAIYELSLNPKMQEKLRKEVTSVLEKHNGIITYEAIMEMEYLSKIVDETLRKYPPAASVSRKCSKDYHVEGTDLVIKRGVKIFISVLALHRDPEYYPNPDVFDPERFNEANKRNLPSCTYVPFLDGPRNCIGLKFGLIQVKHGLINLLKNFKFSINPRTGVPAVDTTSSTYKLSGDIFIDFEKI